MSRAVSTVAVTDPVFDQHNALKADRKHLPHRATALLSGTITVSANTTTVDFPKYADLQIFVSVNFDPGTGLLCALGSEARFRQRVPFGQTSTVQRTWAAEAQTLLTSTIDEERSVVISFLSRLAEAFEFVHNTAPDHGGAQGWRRLSRKLLRAAATRSYSASRWRVAISPLRRACPARFTARWIND